MKFTKFGKALLMSALSTGVLLSVTSCVEDYTVGYVYVTGTVTANTTGNGIISGFKIDHNRGSLVGIYGLPVSSGGANPVRAVLISGSRFLYVLNRGVNAEGTANCTTSDPCQGSNITQFAVGANGFLSAQETFYTQGINPFRIISDQSGSYIYVLDHDAPSSSACQLALGSSAQTCGDITAFSIDPTTGRLSLIENAQVTAAGGTTPLTYFPVPANPVDFVLTTTGYVLTLTASQFAIDPVNNAYTGGTTVFPYAFTQTSGQLVATGTGYPWDTLTDSSPGGVPSGTAIVYAGGYVYVLDNEPITVNGSIASQSQILPYTVGANGALLAVVTGSIPDDANQSNPYYMVLESRGRWFYVANQGNPNELTIPLSGITGYIINNPYQPVELGGLPVGFGTGSGPQCIVEDPSSQYIYTANINDLSVTGQVIDQNAGTLTPLSVSTGVASTYLLQGPPTWCLVDGRTD